MSAPGASRTRRGGTDRAAAARRAAAAPGDSGGRQDSSACRAARRRALRSATKPPASRPRPASSTGRVVAPVKGSWLPLPPVCWPVAVAVPLPVPLPLPLPLPWFAVVVGSSSVVVVPVCWWVVVVAAVVVVGATVVVVGAAVVDVAGQLFAGGTVTETASPGSSSSGSWGFGPQGTSALALRITVRAWGPRATTPLNWKLFVGRNAPALCLS